MASPRLIESPSSFQNLKIPSIPSLRVGLFGIGLEAYCSQCEGLKERLELLEPARLSDVHIAFDTGLESELLLSGSDKCSDKSFRGLQPQTVKYRRPIKNGKVVAEELSIYLVATAARN